MQSRQSKNFSRISVWVIVLISVFVLVKLGLQAAGHIPTESFKPQPKTPAQIDDSRRQLIYIKTDKGDYIHTIVASTSAELERGLSGRASLPKGSGMVFIFAQPGAYGFWMRDMNFPIDMVWIKENKTVAGVAANVSPDSFPQVFYPPAEILYVLELPAGSASDYKIATGTKLVF